jgi:hypothetical protein
MGNAARRKRSSQRLPSDGSCKKSKRLVQMSPGSQEKLQTGYRPVEGPIPMLSFEGAYDNEDAEWKATQRARAALPKHPAKRAKVLHSIVQDKESKLFAEACCGGDPKEIAALRLLGRNIHALATQHTHGESTRNDVRHLRKVLAAIACSQTTRSDRLMRETARITGLNHRVLLEGIIFRKKLLQNDVKALCAHTVCVLDRVLAEIVLQKYASPGNTLTPSEILKIIEYYDKAGATDPGAKPATRRVVNPLTGVKIKVEHAKQYYPTTGTEFFREFIKKHPAFQGKLGQRTFDAQRPWWYKKRCRSDRRTCACIHHVGPKLAVESFARLREKNINCIRALNKERLKQNQPPLEEPPAPVYSLNAMVEAL